MSKYGKPGNAPWRRHVEPGRTGAFVLLLVCQDACQKKQPVDVPATPEVVVQHKEEASNPERGDVEEEVRIHAIRTLAAAELRDWHGLPRGCSRSDVERALSFPAASTKDMSGHPGPFSSAPTAGAPYGVNVNYLGDQVTYIWIAQPRIDPQTLTELGQPDGIIPSLLEGSGEQWVYAGRGLALHMDRRQPSVRRLYAFASTSLEAFRSSPLSRVRVTRYRME